jgi:CPA2 family monovalent cation:H+ antiporter-2
MAAALLEFGIVLLGVALAGALALRVGVSVIPAYIAVGILIGPHAPSEIAGLSLTLIEEGPVLDLLAELGIVFLLFFLGLEFSVDTLMRDRGRIGRAGTIDFVLNFGAGLALGVLFGFALLETLFLAGIVYISSSAIVTKSLIDEGWVANPEGEAILGTLVFEDILIAVYLAVLAALVVGGDAGFTPILRALALTAVILGALLALAMYGGPILERAFGPSSDEQFLLRILAVTTLLAGLALAAGVSEAVAAFFVGTAFSGTSHVERLEHVVTPLRDFFAAIFFFAIGLTIDVLLLAPVVAVLAAAVVVSTGTKLASGTLSGQVYGLGPTRSLRVGLGLVPRGEFSLVIAALAAGTPAVGDVIPALAVGYVLVMSLVGTLLIQFADPITARLAPVIAGSESSPG